MPQFPPGYQTSCSLETFAKFELPSTSTPLPIRSIASAINQTPTSPEADSRQKSFRTMFAPARQTLLLLRQRLPRVAKLASAPRLRRQISTFRARAIYTAFRATLHYFNPHRVSRLFDKKGMPNHPDSLHNQAVALAEDGLVYPAHTAYCRDSELVCQNVGGTRSFIAQAHAGFQKYADDALLTLWPGDYKRSNVSAAYLVDAHIHRYALRLSLP